MIKNKAKQNRKSGGNLCSHFLTVDQVCGSDGKESAYSAGDLGSIPGWGRSSSGENGNPLQYSWLENSRDRGACWGGGVATVHGISESDITERQTRTQVARANGKLNFTGVPSPNRRVSLTEAVRGHSRTFPHYYTTLAMLSILSKININFKK